MKIEILKKSLRLMAGFSIGGMLLIGCARLPLHPSPQGVVTQVSTYDALFHGLYQGAMPLRDLKHYGDFGLGTLEGWNGEVVLLDGQYYLVPGDGRVAPIKDLNATTPFMELTFFDPDIRKTLPAGTSYLQLQQNPTNFLPTVNFIYAVRIEGHFAFVKTRSMPKQSPPYQPMAELVKTQPVFGFTNVVGTMIGFWSPPFMKGVSLPGWHLHFLTQDRRAGGHVLAFTAQDVEMTLEDKQEFRWLLPKTEAFRRSNFSDNP